MNDIGGQFFEFLANHVNLHVDHAVEKVVAANVAFYTTAHGHNIDYTIEHNSVLDAAQTMDALKVLEQISNLKILLTLERALNVDASFDDIQRKVIQIRPDDVLIDSEYEHFHFSKKITLPEERA